MTALADYVRHAERFGVKGVFEAAVDEQLDGAGLAQLARRLRELDADWRPPSDVTLPVPRTCARPGCDEEIAGRADRRTCSPACRVALHRQEAASRAPRSRTRAATGPPVPQQGAGP